MIKGKFTPWLTFLMAIGLLLGSGSAPVVANSHHENRGNNIYLTNEDGLSVEILGGGNIPQFTFWNNANSDNTTYRIKLSSLFEATDDNDDGFYKKADDSDVAGAKTNLVPAVWEFSEFDEADNGDIHFNMTSTNLDFEIQFRFHLFANDDSSLKFDVLINGYAFSNDQAMLVLSFSLKVVTKGSDGEENGEEDPDTEQNGDTVDFGNGFFQSEETASDDNGDVNVGLSAANDAGKKLYLAYGHFTGDLNHDPTIGVQAAAIGESSTSDERIFTTTTGLKYEDLSLGDTVAPSILATLGFLSVILVISRKKRA